MVYAGKAYKYPETDRVEFLLNNVAENYLSNGIIFNTSKTIVSPEYLKPFTLITSSGNEKPITFSMIGVIKIGIWLKVLC